MSDIEIQIEDLRTKIINSLTNNALDEKLTQDYYTFIILLRYSKANDIIQDNGFKNLYDHYVGESFSKKYEEYKLQNSIINQYNQPIMNILVRLISNLSNLVAKNNLTEIIYGILGNLYSKSDPNVVGDFESIIDGDNKLNIIFNNTYEIYFNKFADVRNYPYEIIIASAITTIIINDKMVNPFVLNFPEINNNLIANKKNAIVYADTILLIYNFEKHLMKSYNDKTRDKVRYPKTNLLKRILFGKEIYLLVLMYAIEVDIDIVNTITDSNINYNYLYEHNIDQNEFNKQIVIFNKYFKDIITNVRNFLPSIKKDQSFFLNLHDKIDLETSTGKNKYETKLERPIMYFIIAIIGIDKFDSNSIIDLNNFKHNYDLDLKFYEFYYSTNLVQLIFKNDIFTENVFDIIDEKFKIQKLTEYLMIQNNLNVLTFTKDLFSINIILDLTLSDALLSNDNLAIFLKGNIAKLIFNFFIETKKIKLKKTTQKIEKLQEKEEEEEKIQTKKEKIQNEQVRLQKEKERIQKENEDIQKETDRIQKQKDLEKERIIQEKEVKDAEDKKKAEDKKIQDAEDKKKKKKTEKKKTKKIKKTKKKKKKKKKKK